MFLPVRWPLTPLTRFSFFSSLLPLPSSSSAASCIAQHNQLPPAKLASSFLSARPQPAAPRPPWHAPSTPAPSSISSHTDTSCVLPHRCRTRRRPLPLLSLSLGRIRLSTRAARRLAAVRRHASTIAVRSSTFPLTRPGPAPRRFRARCHTALGSFDSSLPFGYISKAEPSATLHTSPSPTPNTPPSAESRATAPSFSFSAPTPARSAS